MPVTEDDIEQEIQTSSSRAARRKHGARKLQQNTVSLNALQVSSTHEKQHFTLYPAYCHKISATSFAWVKLTAWQIHHALKAHEGFQTSAEYHQNGYNRDPPLLLFYLNHPIQFVQVVGVVVSFEDYFDKFWLFTIDDGSGATIDVTCRKLEVGSQKNNTKDIRKEENKPTQMKKEEDADEINLHNLLSSTQITIGTVLQVKGTLTKFRLHRQLRLHRLKVIQCTSAEISLIDTRTKFLQDVLSKPWKIDKHTQEKLREEALGEANEESERMKRRKLREKRKEVQEQRHAKQIHDDYESEEVSRKIEADYAKQAGEAWERRKLRQSIPKVTAKPDIVDREPMGQLDEKQRLLHEAFGKEKDIRRSRI